jgi:hypothetical protein
MLLLSAIIFALRFNHRSALGAVSLFFDILYGKASYPGIVFAHPVGFRVYLVIMAQQKN